MSRRKKRLKRANGKGTVYKLTGNRRKPWVAAKTIGFDDEGKQKIKVIGYFEKEDEAMLALLTYENKPTKVDKNTTVTELYQMIYDDAEKENLSKSTLDTLKASYGSIKGLKNESLYNLTSMDFNLLLMI